MIKEKDETWYRDNNEKYQDTRLNRPWRIKRSSNNIVSSIGK
jgi:hypothetical protein